MPKLTGLKYWAMTPFLYVVIFWKYICSDAKTEFELFYLQSYPKINKNNRKYPVNTHCFAVLKERSTALGWLTEASYWFTWFTLTPFLITDVFITLPKLIIKPSQQIKPLSLCLAFHLIQFLSQVAENSMTETKVYNNPRLLCFPLVPSAWVL